MDEFMLLVRGKDPHTGSPEEMQQRMGAYLQWMQKMISEGRYRGGQPLEEGEVRLLKDKDQVLTDGPFMDAKEMIGGFIVIAAADIDEAAEIARTCPMLDFFQLEVRKLKAMKQ